jgi:hypothetical protein
VQKSPQIVQNLYTRLAQPEFVAEHKTTPTAFTRTRKLPFQILCLYLLNLVKGAVQSELDEFFAVVHQHAVETRFVTASAFSQAREHLKHTAFEALNHDFVRQFRQLKTTRLWRNFRVCAIDSSTLRLPESAALTEYFGGQDNTNGLVTMARLSTCFDVDSGLTLDAQIAPYLNSERDLAVHHLSITEPEDLLLYDRGYPAFWLFALHKSLKRDFCMRASSAFSPSIAQFVASDACDALIEFIPTPPSKVRCAELNLSTEHIQLRALKIVLSTGEVEVLLTTLNDTKLYPHEDFHDLYGRRWGIEVDYHFKKNKIEIENFTGLSVHAVQQDIAAKVLTHNIVMAAACCAQEKVKKRYARREHQYKINVSHGVSAMKHLLVKMFSGNQLVQFFEGYVNLLLETVGAVRLGRSFPRKSTKIRKIRFYTSVKRAR